MAGFVSREHRKPEEEQPPHEKGLEDAVGAVDAGEKPQASMDVAFDELCQPASAICCCRCSKGPGHHASITPRGGLRLHGDPGVRSKGVLDQDSAYIFFVLHLRWQYEDCLDGSCNSRERVFLIDHLEI